MSLLSEFKEFALKGSVIDLAVGLIIGVVFGAMVTSMVQDVLTPPLGWLAGGLDFKDKAIMIQPAGATHPITHRVLPKDVKIEYGKFINAAINFLIQALAIFLFVKLINATRRKTPAPPDAPPAPTKEEALLMEIRDLLKARAA